MALHRKFMTGMMGLVLLLVGLSPCLMSPAAAQSVALPQTTDSRVVSITLTVDEETATAGLTAIWALLPLPDWLSILSPQVNFKPEHLACVDLMIEVPFLGRIAVGHACLKAEVIDGQISITIDSVGAGGSITVNGSQVEIKNIDKAARKLKKAFKRYVKQLVKQAAADQTLLGLTISDISMTDSTMSIVIASES